MSDEEIEEYRTKSEYYRELKAYAMSHPMSEEIWDCFASVGYTLVNAYMHQKKFYKAKEYAEEMNSLLSYIRLAVLCNKS